MNNKMREILTKISPIEIYDCNREVSNSRQIFFIKNDTLYRKKMIRELVAHKIAILYRQNRCDLPQGFK